MELRSNTGLNKTIEDIKRGKFFPAYLVYGDENYLVKEAAQKMIESILPEKDKLSLETFEGDEDWDKVILSLKTYPLFGPKRVVSVKDTEIFYSKFVVEEVLERSREEFERGQIDDAIKLFRVVLGYLKVDEVNDEVGKELENLLDFSIDSESQKWIKKMVEGCLSQGLNPIPYEDHSDKLNNVLKNGIPQNNILVLCTDSVDKRKKLYKTINDIGIIIDLSIQRMRRDLSEMEEKRTLQQQANELLKRTDKIFAKGAFDTLANKTGYHMGIFLNELEKVVLSVEDRKRIEVRDIEEIVGRTKEDSAFDLQKAVGQRDLEKSLFYLKELLGQGEFHLKLLQNIANEIRSLIAAKQFIENELKTKWNPQLDPEKFKKFVYFPIVLKLRKEKDKDPAFKRSRYNIFKLPPDVLMELLKSSENFTKEELYRSMRLLAETDLKMKSVGVLPVHLLEKAIMDICSSNANSNRFASLEL